MDTLSNIKSAFLLCLMITMSSALQASPLLVLASKSIAVEVISPEANPSNKFQAWKQKRVQKMVDRKLRKLKQQNKSAKQKGKEEIKIDPLAKASLITGIISPSLILLYFILIMGTASPFLSLLYPFSILAGIAAIITGFISRGRIKRNPEKYKGKGKATAGIILGFSPVIPILIAVAWLFFFFR